MVYADGRFFYVACLLLRQFNKTFTPLNRKFQGKIDQNLLIFAQFWENQGCCLNKGLILMGMVFLEMS